MSSSSSERFSHKLPGEHVYEGVLFFEYSPPDVLDAVKAFPVRDDDVYIVTYPKAEHRKKILRTKLPNGISSNENHEQFTMQRKNKSPSHIYLSGTTWLQEILWIIMNNGDMKGASEKPVYFRSPFLEFKDIDLNEVGLDLAEQVPSPRIIKTHLQKRLAPNQLSQKNCKIIILFRNPKDVCVSYYHFYRSSSSMGNYKGTWKEFVEMFLDGHTGHGSWFDFTESWWQSRNDSNVKLFYYEDMKKDLGQSVRKIASFLGKSLTESQVETIVQHCSFDSMKKNPMTNHEDVYSIDKNISPLLRKGTVGDWKNHFTVFQNEIFDQVFEEKLGHLNIPFTYQL